MSKLSAIVGTPCNVSEGCHTKPGQPRPKTVKLGKSGSWPQAEQRNINGVKSTGKGRYGSHLD